MCKSFAGLVLRFGSGANTGGWKALYYILGKLSPIRPFNRLRILARRWAMSPAVLSLEDC